MVYIVFVIKLVYFKGETIIANLEIKNVPVFIEYSNFIDIFFSNFIVELLEHCGINDYPIDLQKDKQLFYRPIYSLKLVELKLLKSYI